VGAGLIASMAIITNCVDRVKRVLGIDYPKPYPQSGDDAETHSGFESGPMLSIHFESGHDVPHVVCGNCGERIKIRGEGVVDCEPVGCGCQGPNFEYQMEVLEENE